MSVERVQQSRIVPATAAAVWGRLRDFADPWHPLIDTMRAEHDDQRRLIRAFTITGETTTYRERLTWFSDSDRRYGYTHVAGIADVRRYDGWLSVAEADDPERSRVTLTAEFDAPTTRAPEIAEGTRAIFLQGLDGLAGATFPEPTRGDSPNPETPIATQLLDTLPRLALDATPRADGPLVLFLHGIGGARGNWYHQLSRLGQISPMAALDLRGYGQSTLGPAPSTVDDYCDDILRVRRHFGDRPLVLCGLSYGAWIATSFAMRHPGLLAGLVLSGGCTGMSEAGPDEREAFRISREIPLDAGQAPADFAAEVVDVIAGPAASSEVRSALLASMSAIPSETYRDALRCFTNPLERFDFSRISCPVLMMTGEHDRLAPPAEIRSVAERILRDAGHPDVRFETIEKAGHVCNLENPSRYNRILGEFLGRIAR